MTNWPHLVKADHGFLPMLLALLIAAGGVIGLSVIALNRSAGQVQKDKSVNAQLGDLEKAIRAETYRTRRLPCPALGDGDGGAQASCTGSNNDGVVPWRSLGLTRADVTDPYGRLISYSIDPDLAAATDDSFCNGATARPGAIRLNPTAQTSLFVLVSHGPNGRGGWLPIGSQSASPASAQERENCADRASGAAACTDPDPRAVTQGPHQGDSSAGDFFDDTILAAISSDYTPICVAAAPGGSEDDEHGDDDDQDDGGDDDDHGHDDHGHDGDDGGGDD